MKSLLLIITFILPTLTFGLMAAEETEFKVYGACGMCEARIEKAAKSIDGVTTADWDRESKMLTLTYDADNVNLEDVHKKIAKAGHDTKKVRAKDDVYEELPSCCHYERPSDEK
jgi:copper chaperone CopZ